jgi:uncharacterized RDD family membrane protein YckC
MSSQATAPLPKTGLPAGVQTGPLGKRLAAQLIDVAVPAVALVVALSVGGTAAVVLGSIVALAWVLLAWWMGAKRAATPGMRPMKIQVVGLRDGRPVGWGRFAVRELVLLALAVTVVGLLVMGYFLARQPRKQGWHDLVAESVVIKERPLAPPQPRAQVSRPAPPAVPAPARPAPGAAPPAAAPTPLTPPVAQPAPRSPHASGSTAVSPAAAKPGPRPVVTIEKSPDAPPAPAARPVASDWRIVLDDGRTLDLTGLVLLGRNPQPRSGEDGADLVKVADETRTVSKTHLALGVDPRGVFVVDRGSTNGSTVTNTSGVSSLCMAGEVVYVAEGSIVSFGEHWLRVEHRPRQ